MAGQHLHVVEHGGRLSTFERAAEASARLFGRPWFFLLCAAGVLAWGALGPFVGFSDRWQLWVNTSTTILTFLMVALLQNSTRRGERALQHKLDAIADALADFMRKAPYDLDEDVEELLDAVGLEKRQRME